MSDDCLFSFQLWNGDYGLIKVQILGSMLDASIVKEGMVLGKTLVAVAIIVGTSVGPLGGALGWPSYR